MTRIPTDELFRLGPNGLEPISDETIARKLDEIAALRQGYAAAVAEEMLQTPEAV